MFSLTFGVFSALMGFGLSDRNEADALPALGVNHDEQSALHQTHGFKARFAVVLPVVFYFQPVRVEKNLDGIEKVNAVLPKIFGGLAVMPFEFHRSLYGNSVVLSIALFGGFHHRQGVRLHGLGQVGPGGFYFGQLRWKSVLFWYSF
jgi:hypothetical protein